MEKEFPTSWPFWKTNLPNDGSIQPRWFIGKDHLSGFEGKIKTRHDVLFCRLLYRICFMIINAEMATILVSLLCCISWNSCISWGEIPMYQRWSQIPWFLNPESRVPYGTYTGMTRPGFRRVIGGGRCDGRSDTPEYKYISQSDVQLFVVMIHYR